MWTEALREQARDQRAPCVSANTTDEAGNPLVPTSVEVSVAGHKVLVVGVVSPAFATAKVKVSDPQQAVLKAQGEGGNGDRTVIVLAYVAEEGLNALASSLAEVDAVIGGPTGQAVAPRAV